MSNNRNVRVVKVNKGEDTESAVSCIYCFIVISTNIPEISKNTAGSHLWLQRQGHARIDKSAFVTFHELAKGTGKLIDFNLKGKSKTGSHEVPVFSRTQYQMAFNKKKGTIFK